MACRAANSLALAGSRAATAATVTSPTWRAGLSKALGAIFAAPSTPIRSAVTQSLPPLASGSSPARFRHHASVQFRRHGVDGTGQFGVGLELEFRFDEVVVGLGLLE